MLVINGAVDVKDVLFGAYNAAFVTQ